MSARKRVEHQVCLASPAAEVLVTATDRVDGLLQVGRERRGVFACETGAEGIVWMCRTGCSWGVRFSFWRAGGGPGIGDEALVKLLARSTRRGRASGRDGAAVLLLRPLLMSPVGGGGSDGMALRGGSCWSFDRQAHA
nr:hypothetical protein CFP56_41265 [Quercus suber]